MLLSIGVIAAAYAIGSVPVAYLAGRLTKGVDLREQGSGNVGASNVWQSVSRSLVAPVGLAQIGQGVAAVGIAKLAGESDGVQAAAGVAALVANNWCPWLGFAGGRGIGQSIGVLGWLSPAALAVFIAVSLAGVVLRTIPQGVALAIALAPIVAAIAGQGGAIVAGCGVLAAIVLLKRLVGNGVPEARYARPAVWGYRLLYDRDDRDRDAWVRRNLADPDASAR
ncbi:MAG: glycerol-3-phosphate acyltransferase [Dehalococcoidia bacterium]